MPNPPAAAGAAPAIRPWPDPRDLVLLRRAFAPAPVTERVLRRLLDDARLICCAAGPLAIASPRRPEPSWWLLREGRIGLGRLVDGDGFAEQRVIEPGDWLDSAGALSGHGSWVDQAVCRTPVQLLAIPVEALFEACAEDTTLARAIATVLAQRVRLLGERLHELTG